MASIMKIAKMKTLLDRARSMSRTATPCVVEASTVAEKRTSLLESVTRTGTFSPPSTAPNSTSAP